uniref:Mitochondrial import inner membrane translocase subunit TIM50 n=1 Tax=Molossus molossus TaxID=27622 RepID=A0A7J8FQZ5_MOLMO|nr:CTD small phosphatase 1 [Molossus molossus]
MDSSAVITQISKEEARGPLRGKGDQKSSASQKPRSRGILHSLFCCVFHRGNYVKDLSRLGRDLRRVLILDNSPASYVFHPDNAVSVMQDPDRGLRSKKGVSPFGLCLHFCFQAGLCPRPGALSFFLLSSHRPVPTPSCLIDHSVHSACV